MKIGDKILVTYSDGDQLVGLINGETAKSWKVLFDNGDQRTIRKTMTMEVIEDNPKPEPVKEVTQEVTQEDTIEDEVIEDVPQHVDESEGKEEDVPASVGYHDPSKYTPSKSLKRKNLVIMGVIFVVAAAVAAFVLSSVGVF
jgi:hypothetical protein